jgi:hypothetical protein
MSGKHAVLLGLVVVTATTKGIRFREAGTTATVNIAEGVYFVRGNGGATDLLVAIKTALESITGTNTYDVTIVFDTNHNNPTAEVTVTRASGSNEFSVLWADALTTFDPGLIGFERENSAHDAAAKVSTISPSALWVSNNIVKRLEPMGDYERTLALSRGDVARAVERSSRRGRMWHQDLVHAQRMHEEFNSTDPTAALGRFLARHADGKRFEFHQPDLDSGTELAELDALEGGTRVGTFIFDDDFYPRRGEGFETRRDDSPLYSFTGYLVKYHVEDEEEITSPILDGLTHWSESWDTLIAEAGASQHGFNNKSAYTYSSGGTLRPVLRIDSGGGAGVDYEEVAAEVNGKRAMRIPRMELAGWRTSDNTSISAPAQTQHVFGTGGAFQWLVRFPTDPSSFTARGQLFAHSFLQLATTGVAGFLAFRDLLVAGYQALQNTNVDTARHVYTAIITAAPSPRLKVYIDDDFDTALIDVASADISAIPTNFAWQIDGYPLPVTSIAPVHLGLLAYNRVPTAAEFLHNVRYFQSPGSFGPTVV